VSTAEPFFQAHGIVKRFGHVTALSGADFELYAGEVLAVIGDNGAGKSTLIKVLSGALQPDEGDLRLDGETVHFRSPLDARRAGIETVYQDLAVASGARHRLEPLPRPRTAAQWPARRRLPHARQAEDAAGGHARACGAPRRRAVGPGGGREAVRRPAAGRRSRARRGVGATGRDHGRASRQRSASRKLRRWSS